MRTVLIGLWAAALFAQSPQRIKVAVERQDSAGWLAVNPATVFTERDRLRFRVSTTFAGYLYVMDQGTTGAWELLFPRIDTGSDNRIQASKDYFIPSGRGFFRPNGPEGHDVIFWVLSPADLERKLVLPSSSVPTQLLLRPRCDDAIFKARGDCIDPSAGLKPVAPGEKLPENLNGIAGANSRDLVFTEERGQSVVSSPTPLSGPIIYELRLAHR